MSTSRKARTVTLIVTAELPPSATKREFRNYALFNLAAGVGALHPDDPLSDLDREGVKAVVPNRHVRLMLEKMAGNSIKCRQAVEALKESVVTRRWFRDDV